MSVARKERYAIVLVPEYRVVEHGLEASLATAYCEGFNVVPSLGVAVVVSMRHLRYWKKATKGAMAIPVAATASSPRGADVVTGRKPGGRRRVAVKAK